MRRKPYKQFSQEFKREAIRLAEVGDKTAGQVARELLSSFGIFSRHPHLVMGREAGMTPAEHAAAKLIRNKRARAKVTICINEVEF